MAKKELLFSVVILGVVYLISSIGLSLKADASDISSQSVTALPDNIIEKIDENKEFAQKIADIGRSSALSAIKEKWKELRVMMQGAGTGSGEGDLQAINEIDASSMDSSNTTLKVFVSTSMSTPLLASYGKMAKKYGAVLVLKGLPDGSWRKLSDLIYELNKQDGENITVQIDDPAFDEYGITRVPSIVLAQEQDVFEDNKDKAAVFDKITGNIGIRRALEEFAKKGELQTDARAILSKAEGE